MKRSIYIFFLITLAGCAGQNNYTRPPIVVNKPQPVKPLQPITKPVVIDRPHLNYVNQIKPEQSLVGGYLYNKLGGVLNNNDYYVVNSAVNSSLEHIKNNEKQRFTNNETKMVSYVEPVRTYQNDNNDYCRDYKIAISVGQSEANSLETACRISENNWQIIN